MSRLTLWPSKTHVPAADPSTGSGQAMGHPVLWLGQGAGCAVRKALISAYSGSVRRKVVAGMTPSTCFALRPPTIAAVMAGLWRVQATAMTPTETLWRGLMGFRETAGGGVRGE